MCLAVPAKITAIEGTRATVDMAGVIREASLMMLPSARVGDYVILHAGFAIEALDESEALHTLDLFRQMGDPLEPGE